MTEIWCIESNDPDDGYGSHILGYWHDKAVAEAIVSDLIDREIDLIEEERYYADFDSRDLPEFLRKFPYMDNYYSLYAIHVR